MAQIPAAFFHRNRSSYSVYLCVWLQYSGVISQPNGGLVPWISDPRVWLQGDIYDLWGVRIMKLMRMALRTASKVPNSFAIYTYKRKTVFRTFSDHLSLTFDFLDSGILLFETKVSSSEQNHINTTRVSWGYNLYDTAHVGFKSVHPNRVQNCLEAYCKHHSG